MAKLETDEIQKALEDLPNWELNSDGKLERNLKFKDFKEAFAFMTKAAMYAEEKNHHPEWFNVYSQVKIELTTHYVGGVSEKDLDFARFINQTVAN